MQKQFSTKSIILDFVIVKKYKKIFLNILNFQQMFVLVFCILWYSFKITFTFSVYLRTF